jgi:hypothetical protein
MYHYTQLPNQFWRTAFIALLVLCFAPITLASSNDSKWFIEEDKDGITVLSRSVAYSKFKELRGTMTVNTRTESLVELMENIQACPKWLHNCKEGKVLKEINPPAERINYNVIKAPWPLNDRDIVFRSKVSLSKSTNTVKIILHGEEAFIPPQNGRVRVKSFKGHWIFTPQKGYSEINGGNVNIEYQLISDPGVAPVLAHGDLLKSVFNSLENMRDIIKEDNYKNASFSDHFKQKIMIP